MALNETQLELFPNISYLLSYLAQGDILSLPNPDSSTWFKMTNKHKIQAVHNISTDFGIEPQKKKKVKIWGASRFFSVSEKSDFLSPSPLYKFILYFGFGTILVNYAAFAYVMAWDYPSMDQWVWLRRFLVPYADGKIGFFEFIGGEFETLNHSHILTLLALYVNFHLFDLNFAVNALIGHACFIAVMIFCYRREVAPRIRTANSPLTLLPLIAIASLLFSIANRNLFLQNLLAFEQIYLGGAFLCFVVVSNAPNNRQGWIIAFAASTLLITLGDAMGVIAALALLLVYACTSFVQRQNSIKATAIALPILLLIAIDLLVDLNARKHSDHGINVADFVTENPMSIVATLLHAMSEFLLQSWLFLFRLGHDDATLIYYALGATTLIVFIGAFWRYLRDKLFKQSYLPVLLVLFAFLAIAGIFVNRVPQFGPEYVHNARYLRFFAVGGAGILYAYFLKSLSNASRLHTVAMTVVSVLVIAYQIETSHWSWTTMGVIDKHRQIAERETQLSAHGEPNKLGKHVQRCTNDFCRPAIELMKRENLSLFRNRDDEEAVSSDSRLQ